MIPASGSGAADVLVHRLPDYAGPRLDRALADGIDALGGLGTLIRPGDRVLLKPNLLYPSRPEQAIVTHPEVLGAVARTVRDAGGVPLVGDSPPFRSAARVLERSGFSDVLTRHDIRVVEFEESRAVRVASGRYPSVEIAAEVLDADVVINLPKWKTHAQMVLTLAVKNLFGCVVGNRKPEWHFRAGDDHDLFGEVILAVCEAVTPRLTILDGILAMEGDGPGTGGTPVSVGRLVLSRDPVAVDRSVCDLLGLPTSGLPVLRAAEESGWWPKVRFHGDPEPVRDFRLPGRQSRIVFGPRWARGLFRRRLSPRPEPLTDECRACGDCARYCPAGAMTVEDGETAVRIDYDACIRCFCCLEVCPHGAMKMRHGRLGRWLTRGS